MVRLALVAAVGMLACKSSAPRTPVTTTASGSAGTTASVAPVPEAGGKLVIDRSFGDGGHVDFSVGDREHQLSGVAVMPDGGIVAVGHAAVPDLQMAVARFKPSGALDTAFGSGPARGVARIGSHGAFGKTIAVDGAGRILAAGYFYGRGDAQNVLLARVLPDGTLDASFGQAGLVVSDFGKTDDRPSAILPLPSGQILVVGSHSNASGYDTFVARYDDTGALDASFGTQGVAYFDPVPGREFTTRAVRDPADGSIVIGGYIVDRQQGRAAGYVARLRADGTPVPSFGAGGVVIVDAIPVSTSWALAVTADGAVLFGGQLTSERCFVMKLGRDGRPDAAWGRQGAALGPRASDQVYSLLPEASGAVIGVGFRGSGPDSRPLVARWLPSGRLDPAFGSNGVLLGPRDGDFLFGGAFDREGRLVGVGMSSPPDSHTIVGLVMRFAPAR